MEIITSSVYKLADLLKWTTHEDTLGEAMCHQTLRYAEAEGIDLPDDLAGYYFDFVFAGDSVTVELHR